MNRFLLSSLLISNLTLCMSQVTIGFEQSRTIVSEGAGEVMACARVMGSPPSQYAVNISIVYEDRGAISKNDLTKV